MAVAAAPRAPGLLTRLATAAGMGAARGARKLISPHRAALANLTRMPLTVAGFGMLDAAAFALNTVAGLAAGGVLLIVLELMIADEN